MELWSGRFGLLEDSDSLWTLPRLLLNLWTHIEELLLNQNLTLWSQRRMTHCRCRSVLRSRSGNAEPSSSVASQHRSDSEDGDDGGAVADEHLTDVEPQAIVHVNVLKSEV